MRSLTMINDEKTTPSRSPFDLSNLSENTGVTDIVNGLPHGSNLPVTDAEQQRGDAIAESFGLMKDGATVIPRKRRSDSDLPKKHIHLSVELRYAKWFVEWTQDNRYTYEEGFKLLIDCYRTQSK